MPASLIPDVDYEPELFSVKHKCARKVKKSAAVASSSHAGSEMLVLRVAIDRERDQSIEQLRVRQPARFPHLRVHADRGEPGDGVHLVQIQHLAVAGEQEV